MYKMKIKYWSMCSCGALIVSQNLLHLLKQLWLLVSLICEASVWEGLRWIKLTFLTFLPLKSCSSDLLLTGLTANFCVSEKGQRGGAVRADHVSPGHRGEGLLRPPLHGLGTSRGESRLTVKYPVFWLVESVSRWTSDVQVWAGVESWCNMTELFL